MNCIFCNIDKDDYIFEDELAFAIYDKYPVNKGHMLIIPKRHFKDFFEIREKEILSIYGLLDKCKEHLDKDLKPDGYNIGVNVGKKQDNLSSIYMFTLIPRYIGDVAEKRLKGGIRNFKEAIVKY